MSRDDEVLPDVCNSSNVDDDKDKAIRITHGKYAGCNGWLRKSKRAKGDNFTYVIVDLGKKGVKKAYVANENISSIQPQGVGKAILQQHKDIEVAMDRLVRQMATLLIEDNLHKDLLDVFNKKYVEAIKNQKTKGAKARYRIIK